MFIALAQSGGFLDELDLSVLHRAASQMASWRSDGLDVGLAVNASPERFTVEYATRMIGIVGSAGLDPTTVTVEVTEAPVPQLRPEMRAAIDALHREGMSISVDDFDGATTTVAMIESLPIDEVKIDRSLTRRSDPAADDMIAEVVQAAELRGWRTVAEGIETLADLNRTRARRCQRGQGFLWGRPSSAVDLEAMLVRR